MTRSKITKDYSKMVANQLYTDEEIVQYIDSLTEEECRTILKDIGTCFGRPDKSKES